MKQLKRAAAVLLAVCLIFSLAACGGVNIDKTAKNLHIEQAENIRVWYCDDRYTDYLNFVADRFHSANELVTIEPVLVDSDNYLENIYEESVRNGNVADVYLMLTDELEKASMMGLTVQLKQHHIKVNFMDILSHLMFHFLYTIKMLHLLWKHFHSL